MIGYLIHFIEYERGGEDKIPKKGREDHIFPSFEDSKGGKKIEGLSEINSNAINNKNNNKTAHS